MGTPGGGGGGGSGGGRSLAPDISSGRSSYIMPVMMGGDPLIWGTMATSPPLSSSSSAPVLVSSTQTMVPSPYYPMPVSASPSDQVARFATLPSGGSGGSVAGYRFGGGEVAISECHRQSLLTRRDVGLAIGASLVVGIVVCLQKPNYIMTTITPRPETGEPPRRVVSGKKLALLLGGVAAGIMGADILYRLLS